MDEFNYRNAQFDYEPYPICYIPNFLSDADYKELSETYPPLEIFQHKPELGNKYSLAEINNPKFYYDFLKKNPAWNAFFKKIKSKEYILEVMQFLRDNHIDLGIRRFWYTGDVKKNKRSTIGRIVNKRLMRSRFEFSIMSANGGNILPHTDDTRKMVTLVLSFIKPGEWDASWGGGTDMLKPKDRTKSFNFLNAQIPFDQVETVKTYPFNPNQCLLFIKTYNSLHSVTPMHGPESGLRKTVTINIENIV